MTVVEDEKNKSEGLYVKGCRNLAGVLRKARSVEELKLGFQGRTKKSIHLILEAFQQDEFTFRHLRKVSFQYCTTTSKDLFDFLVRHKGSLKEVQLGGEGLRTHRRPNGGVHLEDGSIKDLFERLKAEMPACEMWVIGDLIGVESGERWLLEDRTRIEELRALGLVLGVKLDRS
ncbi:hypothetical protein HYALB_00004502 [Hymenoscyphus albidus]|uniref:Uncharacterized protein n=1 Tax=Hymenoscyphus albidus TaxID=595503 RepID=A0A9N9LWP2_9HELO|nr:hypothetical protein HYALB_00004502 [Hymenoscyphus albidus]